MFSKKEKRFENKFIETEIAKCKQNNRELRFWNNNCLSG